MENLINWRKSNGVTQEALAGQLGIAKSTLSKYEKKRLTLKPDMAKRIESLTNGRVSASDLLGLSDTNSVQKPSASLGSGLPVADEARSLGLDPEAIAAEAIAASVKRKRLDVWLEENSSAFAANAKDIDNNGLWSDRRRLF